MPCIVPQREFLSEGCPRALLCSPSTCNTLAQRMTSRGDGASAGYCGLPYHLTPTPLVSSRTAGSRWGSWKPLCSIFISYPKGNDGFTGFTAFMLLFKIEILLKTPAPWLSYTEPGSHTALGLLNTSCAASWINTPTCCWPAFTRDGRSQYNFLSKGREVHTDHTHRSWWPLQNGAWRRSKASELNLFLQP